MKKMLLLCLVVSIGLFGCGSGSGGGGISYFQSGSFEKTISSASYNTNSIILDSANTDDKFVVTIKPTIKYYSNALNKLPFSIRDINYKYTKINDPNYVISDSGPNHISLPNDVPYTVVTASVKDKIYKRGFESGDEFFVTADFTVYEEGPNISEKYTNVSLAKVRFQ